MSLFITFPMKCFMLYAFLVYILVYLSFSVLVLARGKHELAFSLGYTCVRVCVSELETLSVRVSPLSLSEIYCR